MSYGSFCGSAPRYIDSEDVRIVPVVVAELELGDVEWEILCTHFVEGSHDAAFDEAPEAVNGLGMDRTPTTYSLRLWRTA